MEKVSSRFILGVKIHAVDCAGALEIIEEFVQSGKPHIVVTADSTSVVMAQRDQEFKRIMNEADLVTPDGAGLLWASKRLDSPLPERVCGVDMVERLCEISARAGYSVFLLGAAPGVAEAAARKLVEKYPKLEIAGTHHGFFEPEESDRIARQISESKPDILFVALGIPMQEKWIYRRKAEMRVPVSMGVGGAFDVISGHVKRAPKWMQSHGLEWVYRLLTNPRKIRKVSCLPGFVLRVLRASWGGKKGA